MRRLLPLVMLGACSGSSAKPDSPAAIDAPVCDCILPADSYFPDSTLQAPGTHTFQIDIADGDTTPAPTGNWVEITFDQQNSTIPNIQDAAGQATTISLTTALWMVQDQNPANWTAGNIGWMQAVAAQDTWGASAFAMFPSTLKLANLDGRYKVEVVIAYYNDSTPHHVDVNGATTTTTYKAATGKDSAAWRPLDDGTTPGDWLVWPDVNPSSGAITIEILPGRLNAVRFSPP